jgi:hypothetical protein
LILRGGIIRKKKIGIACGYARKIKLGSPDILWANVENRKPYRIVSGTQIDEKIVPDAALRNAYTSILSVEGVTEIVAYRSLAEILRTPKEGQAANIANIFKINFPKMRVELYGK